jgi:hypothetical protein
VLSATSVLAACRHRPESDPPLICGTPQWVYEPPARVPSDVETIAAVEAHGARYEVCPSQAEYMVTREGTREPTEGELHRFGRTFFESAVSVATGRVGWPPTPNRLGVVMRVPEDTLTPERVAAWVASQAEALGSEVTLRVQVRPVARPGRHCNLGDQTCEPMPYDGLCAPETRYEPPRKRSVLSAGGQGTSDHCADDGNCFIDGCGDVCASADARPNGPGICERHPDWGNVYCGCVQDRCVWFRSE